MKNKNRRKVQWNNNIIWSFNFGRLLFTFRSLFLHLFAFVGVRVCELVTGLYTRANKSKLTDRDLFIGVFYALYVSICESSFHQIYIYKKRKINVESR